MASGGFADSWTRHKSAFLPNRRTNGVLGPQSKSFFYLSDLVSNSVDHDPPASPLQTCISGACGAFEGKGLKGEKLGRSVLVRRNSPDSGRHTVTSMWLQAAPEHCHL